MTPVGLIDAARALSLDVLSTLAWASVDAAVLTAVVWGLCRALPALPAAVRTWLWWLVSLKLLLALVPGANIALPLLPTTAAWAPAPVESARPSPPATAPPMVLLPDSGASVSPADSAPVRGGVSVPYTSLWPLALVGTWALLLVAQICGLGRAWRRARHLRREAAPAPAHVLQRVAVLVTRFALPVLPRVLTSRLAAVPLLTGVFRPAILLPVSAATLSRAEVDLMLGHELAHVRRGDLAWGWVPALAARAYCFNPLARLALREYLAAREQACDADVLRTLDASPADYGQLIVKLGVATTDDVLAAAGSSPTFALLKRRLIMLDRSRTPVSHWWWAVAGATAVMVPLTLVAQPVAPPVPPAPPAPLAAAVPTAPAAALAPAPVAPPAAPAAPDAPAPPDAPDEAWASEWAAVPSTAPRPPAPPPPPPPAAVAPVPPTMPGTAFVQAPPAPPTPPTPASRGARSRHNDHPWVLLEPGSKNVMSGNSENRADAERQRRGPDDTLLWFELGGQAYVTRDTATIQAVRDAFAPVNALGKEMGRLGEKMGARGGDQGKLGARQAELGARQAALAAKISAAAAEGARQVAETMAAEQAAWAAEAANGPSDRERARAQRLEQRARLRAERDRLRQEERAARAELDAQMRALGDQQRALGEQMRAMGKGMDVEGAQLEALGSQMEERVAQAQARVAALFADAVRTGKAAVAR